MSKRITSFLVGALAAVLLGVPAQAQSVAKRGGNSNATFLNTVTQHSRQTLADILQSKEFVGMDPLQQAAVLDKAEKVHESNYVTPLRKGLWALNLHEGTPVCSFDGRVAQDVPVAHNGHRASATTDANGIITEVEGDVRLYKRAGGNYYVSGGYCYLGEQSGNVNIVFDEDGTTVYVQNIISSLATGAWVKGTKDGNTITFATAQPVYYDTQYSATTSIFWSTYDEENGFAKSAESEISFTIEGDVISLVGSSQNKFVGVWWDDDNSFMGYGDFESIWTYQGAYEPASTDPIVAPAGLVAEDWFVSGEDYSSSSPVPFNRTAKVGIDGNDLYIQGLCPDFPNSWIKGTIDGTTVTFPKFQFQGVHSYYDVNIWAVGYGVLDESLGDFVMNYDAEAKTLTLDESNYLSFNAADDRLYYLELIMSLTISATYEEPTAETGAPIDQLPYSNTIDTADDFAAFGVLDANNDGKTWTFNEDGMAQYTYSSSNDGDDWLITPAVYLEKGKAYAFSVDAMARSASYPERVEVKLGAEPKASAFEQQVIAPTDVTWADALVTLSNDVVTVAESGYYHFGIHAISDADQYCLYVDNIVIEEGADPNAPDVVADFSVESVGGEAPAVTVVFTAPAVAINGNPLTELTKIELLRDGNVVKTFTDVAPGQKVVYTDNDETLTVGTHSYQIISYNNAGAGVKSEVLEVFVSAVLSVPYTANFANPNTFSLFNIVDANGDGTTWTNAGAYAQYTYNSNNDADDYLILSMPIKLVAGMNYDFVAEIASSNSYGERFEVLLGTAPTVEAMKQVIIGPTDIQTAEVTEFSETFQVAADGQYYMAVHAISDADMLYLKVYTLTIEKGLTDAAPGAPVFTSIVADPFGLNKATVTLVAPVLNFGGTSLTDNIAEVKLLRGGNVVKTFSDVRPGQTLVFTDHTGAAGNFSYQAIPYDANGDRGVKSDVEKVYVGLDVPAPVENVVTAETPEGVLIKWDPVTEGANGGVLLPGSVTYDVCTGHVEYVEIIPGWGYEVLVLDASLYTTNDCFAVVDYDQIGDQSYEAFYILTSNEAGSLGADYATPAYYYAGAPYTMPFEEHFSAAGFNYSSWYLLEQTALVTNGITDDASDGDGGALKVTAAAGGESFSFTPGKIEMRQGNPTLVIDLKGDGSAKNNVRIGIQGANGEIVTLAAVKLTNEYKTYKFSLAEFANDGFIKPVFGVDFKEAGSVIFDNLKISDMLEYNLATTIDAPKSINAGETAVINVNVKNIGEMAAEGYTVKLFAGDQQLLKEKVTESLPSYGTKTFAVPFATTIFDEAGDVTLRAEVDFDLDLDDEDNAYETIISIKQSTAAVPENVKAEKTGDGVKLSWTAPATTLGELFTEDFENGFNDWTAIDADGDGNNWTFHLNSGSGNMNTHSGDGAVYSASYDNNVGALTPNNWLVSPQVVLNGTFSFWAVGQDASWAAEHFAVFVSTTSPTDPSSFVQVSQEFVATGTYTEYTVDLSSYAGQTGWVAIRHFNVTDMFVLVVDDITYTRGGGAEVAGYNIYVDGELFDTTTETSIELKGVSSSSVFAVSAVYSNGVESRPVVVTVSGANQEITAIEQLTGNNEPVDIYSLDGRLVRQQATDLNGLKGAFVIKGRKVVVK